MNADGVSVRGDRVRRAAWVLGGCGLIFGFTVQGLRDTDMWWHLALGRLIVAHGIPAHEPFSYMPAAHAWVGQQWGYEVMLDRLVSFAGLGLAMIVMSIVACAALAVAALATRRAERTPGILAAASIVLAAVVASQFLGVRGQVITLLGAAITLLVITRWRDGRTRAVWALPPLFLVWANMHAGFITGFALLAVAAAYVAAVRRLTLGAERPARLRPLLVATALAALATLLNPAGPALYGYVAETFFNPTLTQGINEWMSPNFHVTLTQVFEAQAVLLLLLWVLSRRPDPLDVILAGGLFAASLQAERNIALFAVVATPQVARYAALAWQAHRPARLAARAWRPLPAPVLVVAALAVVAASAWVTHPEFTAPATLADTRAGYPAAAADYVAVHDPGERLYSIYEWGGYLAWRFPTGRVVFIYGESAIFGNSGLQRYFDVHYLRSDWEQVLRTMGARLAIVPSGAVEATAMLETGWQPLCYDHASTALVLRRPADAAPAAPVPTLAAAEASPACA